jgi:hypothetical protein
MTKSHLFSRKQVVTASIALALSAAAANGRADTNATWTGTASTLWSNANNWSTAPVDPNNGNGGVNYAVFIGTPAPTTLNINVTIDSLTINTGGVLNTLVGTNLTLLGNLVDNGTITVNSGQSGGATDLTFTNSIVSGSGSIVLDVNTNNAQINGSLTQSAGHTIQGFGEINAALTNNGTVNANAGGQTLFLQTNAMTNNAIFEATAGSVLNIGAITVTQGLAGQILAGNNSLVQLAGATITQGTLNSTAANATANAGIIQITGGATTTFANVTNNAAVNIIVGNTLNVTGSLVDNGIITVNPGQNGGTTAINFNGGTLSGTGSIVLDVNTVNAEVTGTLTQSASHTIQGFGDILAVLTNNGLVNANVSGQTLFLQTSNMTNNATFEATNGATLNISGITVNQGPSGQILASGGGVVTLTNAIIANGTLNGGTLQVVGTTSFNTLTNNATVNIINTNTLNINGNLVNNGTINVNLAQNGGATTLNFNGGTVSGTGFIVLGYSTNNAQLTGTLTQGANQTIAGEGDITAALTNNGVLNANVSGQVLYLSTNAMTNNLMFEATNGGSLNINGITVTQGAAGQIVAGNNSSVVLTNVTVSHGTLNSAAGNATLNPGVFQIFGTTTFDTLTNNALVDIINTNTLDITGNLINNATINVNLAQSGGGTILSFDGGTVSGTGSIVLGYSITNAQLNGTLTQVAGHSILGEGQINATLTNNGTVNADISGQTLYLQGPTLTNTKLLESTNGSNLQFDLATVVNNTGGNITANGGTVSFVNGATITGGIISAVAPNAINVSVENSTLGYSASFNGLTIAAGTQVNVFNSNILNILGLTFTNNGIITINPTQSGGGTFIDFNANTTLTGTGTIILNYATSNAELNTGANDTLTQDVHHTIQGFGQINAALINNGTVNANVFNQVLTLQTDNITNNALVEATNGGILVINGITVTQGTSGQITVGAASTLSLTGATLSKGVLNGSGVIVVSTPSTLDSLTNNDTISIPAGSALNITGNLTNNGTITINPGQSGGATVLNFNGGVLSGSGAITLNYVTSNAQLNGSLTQSAGHTIQGFGQINAALINNSIVDANVPGQTLTLLTSNMTNNLTFEATSGGTLGINGITVTQSITGQVLAGAGSAVVLTNALISHGTLNGTGTSSFTINGTSTLDSLTNNATINIPVGNQLNITGTLVDNGAIIVNSGQNGGATAITFNGGVLSGTGTILLNGSTTNAQLNGSLTQSAGHTIQGFGQINATLTNNGTVNADVGGQTLALNAATTNNGLLQASGGGTLQIASGVLTNFNSTSQTLTGGSYESDTSSALNLPGAILINAANVTLGGTGVFAAINGFTTNTGSFSVNNAAVFTTVTPFSNTGTLQSTGGAALTVPGNLPQDSAGTLTAGTYIVGNSSILALGTSPAITTIGSAASVILSGANSNFPQIDNTPVTGSTSSAVGIVTANAGTFQILSGRNYKVASAFTNTGNLTVGAGSTFTATAFALNGGTLSGGGTVSAPVTAGSAAHTINPGLPGSSTAATLTLSSLTINTHTTLAFDLTSPTSGATPSVSDRIAVPGTLTLNGGSIQLTSVPATGSLGYYEIIQYGTLAGSISNLTLPSTAGLVYTFDLAHNPGFIDLHRGLLGDDNDDGTVNSVDLNTVLNNLGTINSSWTAGNFDGAPTIDLTDLNDVLNNLGKTFTGGLSVVDPTTPTPEPASLTLLACVAPLLIRRSRRR